jgi:hypothetical protein
MGVMGLATTHYLQDRIPRSCVGTGPFRRAVVSGPRTIPLSKSVTGQERRLALEPVIILLGIVIFATALGEGAAKDWLALVLVDDRGVGPAISALTHGGFHLTMAVGRFTGGAKNSTSRESAGVAMGGHLGLCEGHGPLSREFNADRVARRVRLGTRTFSSIPCGNLSRG